MQLMPAARLECYYLGGAAKAAAIRNVANDTLHWEDGEITLGGGEVDRIACPKLIRRFVAPKAVSSS